MSMGCVEVLLLRLTMEDMHLQQACFAILGQSCHILLGYQRASGPTRPNLFLQVRLVATLTPASHSSSLEMTDHCL